MDIKTRRNQKKLVGERIRAARKAKNYTQSKLQELTGIQVSSISEFENGRSLPNIESVAKIAEKLEVSIDSLWYGDKTVAFIESAPNYGAKIVNAYAMLKASGVLKTFERNNNGMSYVSITKHGGPLERLHTSLDEFYGNYNTYSEPFVFEKQLKESVANSINNEIKQAEARRRMGL
ncbi:MAG: helix-turn-helix domain-containing protein [Candidatus Saccharibacteria bacterium]|nr:helix-turn-helix domain-containing protein [Candidatus Saccharibacteria bacterium]